VSARTSTSRPFPTSRDKSDVSLLVDLILECVKANSPYSVGSFVEQRASPRTLYASVGNQVGDGDEWNVMSSRKSTELWHATMVPSLFIISQITPEG